jgi:uncharacterized damage-inducible protein DinB
LNEAVQAYRRWFDYEKDSHEKVLASLTNTSEHLRSADEFQKAIDLMAHIIAARLMWLERFGSGEKNQPIELFPRNTVLSELAARLDQMHSTWSRYFDQLTETELSRVFTYTSYEGKRFANAVEDILTQLFGHSWYHRGQIALLLRQIGAEPAATDFVFWTREPLEHSR